MTTILNILVAGLLAYAAFKIVWVVVAAIKLGIDHANRLEREFGTNVLGAAKFTLSGQSPKKEPANDQ